MIVATGLSYLVVGFIGAVVLVYFLLKSAHALASLTRPDPQAAPGAGSPRAGGLGFVVPVLVFVSLLAGADLTWAWGLLGGCALLTLLGLWEDLDGRRWKTAGVRLAGKACAVALVLWFMQPSLLESPGGWLLMFGVGVAVLWHVDLMSGSDDIDGLTGVHGLLFCVGVQVLGLGIPGWVGDLTWLLAGTVLGFLVFNWPPARVRMGHVGGAFLGLMLAVITLQLWQGELLPLVACMILLAGFWFDGFYTLCVRILNQRASRSIGGRLYQKVARSKGQVWTIVAYVAYYVGWLLPLSWLSLRYPQLELLMLVLAILPMGIAAKKLNAGPPAPDED